jgi:ubiquinone/menaquinone biosynthesis C-methylase UbiE
MQEPTASSSKPRFSFRQLVSSKLMLRRSTEEYNQFLKKQYDGAAGWFTVVTGYLTLHEPLARRIIGPKGFDIRGCKRILDAGTGNGRYLKVLLKESDPDALLVGCDLSTGMLRRAEMRLKSKRPNLLTADVTKLPYADKSFDAAICGWVIEHLPNQLLGLQELHRVLKPGGKLLVLTTEHTFLGAVCSRMYHCRTTRRTDLKALSEQAGLVWFRERWWSQLHKWLGAGGIVVELRRPA